MKLLWCLLAALLPWPPRRWVLQTFCGYELHAESRIGRSIVLADSVVLERGAQIGSLSLVKGLERLHLAEHSRVGNLTWISGFPKGGPSRHFADQPNRCPELVLGSHSAVTNRHYLDCSDSVRIGSFSTFAGIRSQVLTHSIDIELGRQRARPIVIGDYCFVGTGCILLGGAVLPSYSVLGAGSLLQRAYETTYTLYAGVPAAAVKPLEADAAYFTRTEGYVL